MHVKYVVYDVFLYMAAGKGLMILWTFGIQL